MEKITITHEVSAIGKRLDAFLALQKSEFTRGDITRSIKSGAILVNGSTVKPSLKLSSGDEITIDVITSQNRDSLIPNPNIALEVLEETLEFIVVNKQRGLQTHPSTQEYENTLINAVVSHYPEIAKIGDDALRPGIVQRLDKYTSGLLVIARTQESFEALKAEFANRNVSKTYKTLVWDVPFEKSGVIDAPIARTMGYTRQKVVLNNSGKFKGDAKEALTGYTVLEQYRSPFYIPVAKPTGKSVSNADNPLFSLIECKPKTGRMHQIRVHLRHLGHPILGDIKYETKDVAQLNKKLFSVLDPEELHTFYLHAQKLEFSLNQKTYTFKAPLPKYFQKVLNLSSVHKELSDEDKDVSFF